MAKKIKIEGAGADQIIQSEELMATHAAVQAAILRLIWDKHVTRKELKKNPKKVLENLLGIKFDKNISINFIDQADKDSMTYVLPTEKEDTFPIGKELTDHELEAVAGGIIPIVAGIATQLIVNQTGKAAVGKVIGKINGREIITSYASPAGGEITVMGVMPKIKMPPSGGTGLSKLL